MYFQLRYDVGVWGGADAWKKVPYVQYPEFHIAILYLSFEATCYNNECVVIYFSYVELY